MNPDTQGWGAFLSDNEFQRKARDKFILPYYENIASDGRFVLCDGDRGSALWLQRHYHCDTLLQTPDGMRTIDEKCVRWPGYEYENFTLETHSCTIPGRHSLGWMYTSKVDWLVYVFVRQEDALAYILDFAELVGWFIEHKNEYPVWRSKQPNRTECRLVRIADVCSEVKNKPVVLQGSKQEIHA